MTMTLEQVFTVVKELPPHLQKEVGDFALHLREKELPKQTQLPHPGLLTQGTPQFRWVGVLRDMREEFTSVELQHKAMEWRTESLLGKSV